MMPSKKYVLERLYATVTLFDIRDVNRTKTQHYRIVNWTSPLSPDA